MPTATEQFHEWDSQSTLFPMKLSHLMVKHHGAEISDYIYQKALNPACPEDNFLPQQRVHATKPRGHLRRTVKLDPVADYYLYDLVYRNRAIFRKPISTLRSSYGYRFKDAAPIPINAAYKDFKADLSQAQGEFRHSIKFDVASYFNSLYHHDVCHWFEEKNVSTNDVSGVGQFFREINAGRSVDFMPHGIYPAKMIGNEFLKFVDASVQIKSSKMIRFMDDFYLFDDSDSTVGRDFFRIQELLGSKALNVNPSKTYYDNAGVDVTSAVSEIRKSLFEIVEVDEYIEGPSSIDVQTVQVEVQNQLSERKIAKLLDLLKSDSLEEAEAELILSALRSHSDYLVENIPLMLWRFPNISKQIHAICHQIKDIESLAEAMYGMLIQGGLLLEYQIFWMALICEDYLSETKRFGEIIIKLYEMTSEYKVARAKILEIPNQGYGLKEIRAEYLKTGQSDWLAWASAFGTRTLKPAERNYALGYFSKGSPMNYLVATCVYKL